MFRPFVSRFRRDRDIVGAILAAKVRLGKQNLQAVQVARRWDMHIASHAPPDFSAWRGVCTMANLGTLNSVPPCGKMVPASLAANNLVSAKYAEPSQ